MINKTQEDKVITWLAAGHTLTDLQAFDKWHIRRLAARIYELRKVVAIETKLIQRGRTRWAQYRLTK
jgi:hypothetical protein